jgi:hypothetical protein
LSFTLEDVGSISSNFWQKANREKHKVSSKLQKKLELCAQKIFEAFYVKMATSEKQLFVIRSKKLRINMLMKLIPKLPYFIEYSAHFFTLKKMLKYSLRTIHGRLLRNGFRWLL